MLRDTNTQLHACEQLLALTETVNQSTLTFS